MKRLLVLWDPQNPLTPVAPVISALRAKAEIKEVTFQEVAHRTLPNGTFESRPLLDESRADALLWIEGGPLPSDLRKVGCPRACWILNSHHEPSLLTDMRPLFDHRFTALLEHTADESYRFFPIAAGGEIPPLSRERVSLLIDDPRSPSHSRMLGSLKRALDEFQGSPPPVVFCLGQAGRMHAMALDCMRSGLAVVVDPDTDPRGLFHVKEHAEVLPKDGDLAAYLRALLEDEERLPRLKGRAPEIVQHLHAPEHRAGQIADTIWPRHTVLGSGHARPQVSILVTCHRYLRRLGFCLESIARQEMPPGAIEVVVADPESPDGLAAFLPEFAGRNPHLRIVHLPLDARYYRNRGLGINRAFDASTGEVIISIDGDIIFPPRLIKELADRVRKSTQEVFGVQRVFLTQQTTESILAGAIDPFARFEDLAHSEGDGQDHAFVGVLGYCQAVRRFAFAKARYPEEFDKVNQSDIEFVARLGRWAGVRPRFLEEHAVLHLWHPRNWSGTNDLL